MDGGSEASVFLVTGTDTGIGKTKVSEYLLSEFLSLGLDVSALKLIETGCATSDEPSDARRLGAALWLSEDRVSDAQGMCFEAPVAPLLAAELEGKHISVDSLKQRIKQAAQGRDVLLIEGAGGVLVPITVSESSIENPSVGALSKGKLYTYADLAKECSLKVVVVVGSRLGALNQTFLTFEALRQRQISIVGYVLNEYLPTETSRVDIEAINTNRALLKRLSQFYGVRELGYIPYMGKERGNKRSEASNLSVPVLNEVKNICRAILEF